MQELVNIYFKMNINNNDTKQVIDYIAGGKKFIKNNKLYLMFKEPLIEENKYNDILVICDMNEIVINRTGYMFMKQRFQVNELTIGVYRNEYISSELATYTINYEYTKEKINLEYNIVNDGEIIGNYQMEITIKGAGSNE